MSRDTAQKLFWDLHAWSQKTFGDQRVEGILAHLAKEIKELCAAPDDLEEFADVALLIFDATAHAGYSYLELIGAMRAKLEKCKRRKWKKNGDGSFQHVREDA